MSYRIRSELNRPIAFTSKTLRGLERKLGEVAAQFQAQVEPVSIYWDGKQHVAWLIINEVILQSKQIERDDDGTAENV